MYEYNAIVERVVDGDTVEVTLDLGFKIYHKMSLRIYFLDTPETTQAGSPEERVAGEAATEQAKQWLTPGMNVIIHTHKNPQSSFSRYLGQIFFENGSEYATMMVGMGHEKTAMYGDSPSRYFSASRRKEDLAHAQQPEE